MANVTCRWTMLTVPHSGTRYITETFDESGYPSKYGTPRGLLNRGIPGGLLWSHWQGFGKNPHKFDCVEADRIFSVVRDPIKIWSSHAKYLTETKHTPEYIYGRCEDKKICLEQNFRYQKKFQDRVAHWHRVDQDSIHDLELWAGVKLQEGASQHSSPSRIKTAIEERNIDLVKEVMKEHNVDFYDWFVEELSPQIRPLYEDKFGYEFWWM